MRSRATYFAPSVVCSFVAIPTIAAATATVAAMPVSIRRRVSAGPILGSAAPHHAVDRSVERGDVERPVQTLAEGAQVPDAETGGAVLARAAEPRNQRADPAGAEVPIYIALGERAQPGVPDDVAADDRAGPPRDRIDLDR